MKASQILGGLTLGQADMIRKGVSKKIPDMMGRWIELMIYGDEQYKQIQAQRIQQYPSKDMIPVDDKGKPTIWVDYDEHENGWKKIPKIEGALARGFDLDTLLVIQKQWIAFGNYCFNKAHSAAYAFLSCITAWMKCYYPVEFMAALLTMSEGKKDRHDNPKNIHYVKECEEMSITILPPDINKSMSGWTPFTYQEPTYNERNQLLIGEIRYGLSSIGKVSGESVNEVIEKRPYASVEDLVAKTNGTKVNKTKVEALIKAGCFDSLNKNRNLLLRNYFISRHEDYEHIPAQTNKATILAYERECFGTTISIRSRWETIKDGTSTQITGHIRSIDEWKAKSGKTHYTLTVETQEEQIEVTLWGYLLERYHKEVQISNKVTVKGEKSRDKLTASTVHLIHDIYEVDLPKEEVII